MRFGGSSAAWPSSASWRSVLMSSPVLILTGHFSWHMPSAAQVAWSRSGLTTREG